MPAPRSSFWDDLAEDLEDPEFRSEYIRQTVRIVTIDRIIRALDGTREAAGLSKAALARAINVEPATVRRLFSTHHANPTLGTLSEVAAALGLQITLTPLPDREREAFTKPLSDDDAINTKELARHLASLREGPVALT